MERVRIDELVVEPVPFDEHLQDGTAGFLFQRIGESDFATAVGSPLTLLVVADRRASEQATAWGERLAGGVPAAAPPAPPSPTDSRRRALVRGPPNRIWAASGTWTPFHASSSASYAAIEMTRVGPAGDPSSTADGKTENACTKARQNAIAMPGIRSGR